MKRFAVMLSLSLCLAGSAGFASQPAAKTSACRFQPGQRLSGTISIAIVDREVVADHATVPFNFTIPAGGRTLPTGAYVAPAGPLIPVHLVGNSLKHFEIRPHVVIQNYYRKPTAEATDARYHVGPEAVTLPPCTLAFSSMIGDRSWALAEKTNFTITTTVVANGETYESTQSMYVSCLDEATPIRLASGERIPVKDVVAGDLVLDPIDGKALRVSAVTWGTEADETIYHLGFERSAGLFTSGHPIATKRGLIAAADVAPNDELLGEDGAYHKLTIQERRSGDPARAVYNLHFEQTAALSLRDHTLSAGGIVAGDFEAQNRLAEAKARGLKLLALR